MYEKHTVVLNLLLDRNKNPKHLHRLKRQDNSFAFRVIHNKTEKGIGGLPKYSNSSFVFYTKNELRDCGLESLKIQNMTKKCYEICD